MPRLRLVPCHNEQAGRNLPLLNCGRKKLATWWWTACPCRRQRGSKSKPPCNCCKQLATNVKSLPRKMLAIYDDGFVVVRQNKNLQLLWINGEPLPSKHTFQLQPGDKLMVGRYRKIPWMEFVLRDIQQVVTPESDIKTIETAPLKSRKRLFTCQKDDPRRTDESSVEGFSLSSNRRAILPDSERMDSNEGDSYSSATINPERKVIPCRRKLLVATQEGECECSCGSLSDNSLKQTGDKKGATQRTDRDQSKEESSVLLLPLCPSVNDDDDDDEGSSSQALSEYRSNKGTKLQDCRHEETIQFSSASDHDAQSPPNFIPISSLTTSQWKQRRTSQFHQALSSLVVAQRIRTKDPSWLPSMLEGAEAELTGKSNR